jgi:hypothetical protein
MNTLMTIFIPGKLQKTTESYKIFVFADEDEACETLDTLQSKLGEHVVDDYTSLVCAGGFFNGIKVWGRLYNSVFSLWGNK